MTLKIRATIEDLYRSPGKAELVDGEMIRMAPTGIGPGYAGDEIYSSLRVHAKCTRLGIAVSDHKGFRVNLPNRESFSPDAAFVAGSFKSSMKFFDVPPTFAVEVRGEGDYGPAADQKLAAKRSDYFSAGTLIVWDVNLMSADVVKVCFQPRFADDLSARRYCRSRTGGSGLDNARGRHVHLKREIEIENMRLQIFNFQFSIPNSSHLPQHPRAAPEPVRFHPHLLKHPNEKVR
jgi:Uma2 family endonuclease